MLPVNPPQRQDACSQNDYSADNVTGRKNTRERHKETNINCYISQALAGSTALNQLRNRTLTCMMGLFCNYLTC